MIRILLALFIVSIVMSCQSPDQKVDKVEIAKEYIDALNDSDFNRITALFKDSIRMSELKYTSVLSQNEYYPLFQWDSTFHPVYKILKIENEKEFVRMTVSKQCPRILFLNEEPVVTDEFVAFHDDKIKSIQIRNYVVFNDEKWEENRANLTTWVEMNHPEFNGFLHDQTKKGASNYLQAISLYQNYLQLPSESK